MQALQVIGLGWGDESKGAVCDKLTREFPVDLIVRFNGGSQALHHVVLPDGRSHGFSQFGSGMLANNTVRTHLSRFMLVNPLNMMNEAASLNQITDDVWSRTTVDPRSVIITPFHRRLNQLRERERGDARHGSCGQGIGVAREWQIKYGDRNILQAGSSMDWVFSLNILKTFKNIVEEEFGTESTKDIDIHDIMRDIADWKHVIRLRSDAVILKEAKCMVFEGAQGVLLDEKHGTAPHNTWTNTTFENADTLLNEVGVKDRTRIGCLRTYHTRHGAGPFPTENNSLDLPELHNGTGEYQGAFRVGSFDFMNARRAIDIVGGIDYLSLSHVDYLQRMGLKEDFAEDIANILEVPLGMKANGPTADHRTIEIGVLA